MKSMRWCVFLLLFATVTAGCLTREQWGLPREPVSATSPDGRLTAFVHRHPSIDPPDLSIGVRDERGREVEIQRLGADSDWCHVVIWSADNSRVGFLAQDARLVLVDAREARVVSETWLVRQDGYPTTKVAADLSLSSDGKRVSFRPCERAKRLPPYDVYKFEAGACGATEVQDIRGGG
jgi:hypothetical protein